MYYLRKPFATSIDEDIQNEFKELCKTNDIKINDAIELLMTACNKGDINIKTSLTIEFGNQSK